MDVDTATCISTKSEVAMGDKEPCTANVQANDYQFGLITAKILDDLAAVWVGPNRVFSSVVSRIRELLATERLRNAPRNVQIRTELEIDDLLQEIETSIYWNSSGNDTDGVNAIPPEVTGVLHMPRQIQYVRGIHERLLAIYRSLAPTQSDTGQSEFGDWVEGWLIDRSEQVAFFHSIFEAGHSEMQLTDTAAAAVLSEIDFWLRRPSQVTAEEVKLMEYIKLTVNSTLHTAENVEISVKPNRPSESAWPIQRRDIDVKFYEGGGVYHGEWQGASVDVRKVNGDRQSVDREAEIWSGLSHPHIANLLGVAATDDGMLFITEPAEHGNLIKYLESHSQEVWQKLHEVGIALEYLHERAVVHGGLKPDNIRIGRDGRAKLVGFERSVTSENLAYRNIVGDCSWYAPECLNSSENTFSSDVYSFAMCIIAVVSGQPPFGKTMSDAEIGEQVKRYGLRPERSSVFNDDQWELVDKMSCLKAGERMTVDDIVRRLAQFAAEEKMVTNLDTRNKPLEQRVSDRGQWADAPLAVKGGDTCSIVLDSLTFSAADALNTNHPLTIPMRELFIHECERRGGTAHVSRHLGSWLNSKVIIEYLCSTTEINFTRIAEVWFSLKHPNVLQLYGVCEAGNRKFFICEYPQEGNLCSYLVLHKEKLWHTLLDIALGLRYLHSRGVMHGDLKCHNFLVDRGGKAKLAGLECYTSMSNATTPTDREGEEEEKENDIPRAPTSSRWRAPECLKNFGQLDSSQSDVYSFGKCIFEALTGELPEGNHKPDFATTGCLPNERPSTCNHHQWTLIQNMCDENPDERPSMSAVVQQIARFIAVEEAVKRSRSDEVLRVLQSTPDLRPQLHAMVLDHMPEEEEKYAADRIEHQQTLCNLSNIAMDVISQMGDFHDLENRLMNYTFQAVKTVERYNCQQNQRAGLTDLWQIDHADVTQYGDSLGSGAVAEVYLGEWIKTKVALKRWKKNGEEAAASFDNEVCVWYPLNHPHIINLYGAYRTPMLTCVCDYAENGRITQYLSRPEHQHEVWQMLYEAALGLQGVHARGVIHADLKCDNILVTANGKAKISDFGLSLLCEPKSRRSMDKEKKPCGLNVLKSRAVGAYHWKAPEFLQGEPATKMSDTYSFGMCIIEAVSGKNPWGDHLGSAVTTKVKNGELPTRHANFKEDVQWNLVKAMCCRDPSERLRLDDVVRTLKVFARRSSQVWRGLQNKVEAPSDCLS